MGKEKLNKLKNNVLEIFIGGRGGDAKSKIIIIKRCFYLKSHDDYGRIKKIDIGKILWKEKFSENTEQKIEQLDEFVRKINNTIHGHSLGKIVNNSIPFYIKIDGDFLKPICDIEQIKIERFKDLSVSRRKPINHYWMKGNLAPDINEGFNIDDIKIVVENELQEFSKDIEKKIKENIPNWVSSSDPNDWLPYPGPTYGLSKINSIRTPNKVKLEFYLRPTNYFTFLHTQKDYESEKKKKSKKLEGLNVQKPIREFSHSLSPVAFLVVNDGTAEWAVFAKRKISDKLGTGRDMTGLPICVTLKREPTPKEKEYLVEGFKKKGLQDNQITALIEPYEMDSNLFINALIRGAKFELDLDISKEDVKILAYGLDTRRYLYSVIAFASKEMRFQEIRIGAKDISLFGDEQFEHLKPVLFNPESIYEFLYKHKENEICPTTAMAAYYACLHRFEKKEVAKYFELK